MFKKRAIMVRTWPTQLAVLVVCSALGGLSYRPTASHQEREVLAKRFRFVKQPIFIPSVSPNIRHEVNQNASHMRYYLYQVGASAAIGDLDGDGLGNDICYTDVRAKAVVVMPAPGTGNRYAPWVVDFGNSVDLETQFPTVCRWLCGPRSNRASQA
jgi:hypothetical protein